MTLRLALLAAVAIAALTLAALPSRSALPPPGAGIGPVPFRPERFHDFRDDEPVADPFLNHRAPAGNFLCMIAGAAQVPCVVLRADGRIEVGGRPVLDHLRQRQ